MENNDSINRFVRDTILRHGTPMFGGLLRVIILTRGGSLGVFRGDYKSFRITTDNWEDDVKRIYVPNLAEGRKKEEPISPAAIALGRFNSENYLKRALKFLRLGLCFLCFAGLLSAQELPEPRIPCATTVVVSEAEAEMFARSYMIQYQRQYPLRQIQATIVHPNEWVWIVVVETKREPKV